VRRILRLLAITGLLVALVGSSTGQALANSATINPGTQTHNHGVKSSWGLSWTGTAPFDAVFTHGDGSGIEIWTWGLTYNQTHTFWPCTTTTFHQILTVQDSHNPPLIAQDGSTAKEYGGTPC
jgi:hypothetical protein